MKKFILNVTFGDTEDDYDISCTKTMVLGVFATIENAKVEFSKFYDYVKNSKLAKNIENDNRKEFLICDGKILEFTEDSTETVTGYLWLDPDWGKTPNYQFELAWAIEEGVDITNLMTYDPATKIGIQLGNWVRFSRVNTPYQDVEMRNTQIETVGRDELGNQLYFEL